MASQSRRNPQSDPLLTPENCLLVLIDYQAPQLNTLRSMDSLQLVANTVALAETARLFDLPRILSTVGVESGVNPDTWPSIKDAMKGALNFDRTSINAWENANFVSAVKATGRRKIIMGALWTEVCLAFPALDALRDGFEVLVPVDVVGGTSVEAHQAGLDRAIQSGAQPVSWISVLCELQRDWNRENTAAGMLGIGSRHGGPWSSEIALKQFAAPGH
ncbi:isochorismatase family protein [Rhodanobacter glycinis]|uniref:Isochorismatase family protein n=1 Tax=Rhodanobacter glycinis TaxID=582702 RepID=A0A502BZS5_9GAMM|nr:isochorismatase family protein [Rhodanobacter glycinis]TPG05369.1 isochorismatase family protein [Rhodanobacter glycinis]